MHCFFVGGPLDGELREVPDGTHSIPCSQFDTQAARYKGTIYDAAAKFIDDTTYHIANGIARHESVSEEEVSRRVYRWMLSAARLDELAEDQKRWAAKYTPDSFKTPLAFEE